METQLFVHPEVELAMEQGPLPTVPTLMGDATPG